MKKLLKNVAVLTAAVAVLGMFSACGKNVTATKTECKTGWEILQYNTKDVNTGEVEAQSQSVFLNITRKTTDGTTEKVNEVWINVAEISVDEVKLFTARYNSSDYTEYSTASYRKDIALTREEVKNSKDGWIQIVSDYDYGYSYLKIGTTGGIKINEIAVLNEKGEKMTFSVKAAGLILKTEDGKITSKPYYTSDEIKSLNLTDSSPLLLSDEQDKFTK